MGTTFHWTSSLQMKETEVQRAAESHPRWGPRPLATSALPLVSGVFTDNLRNCPVVTFSSVSYSSFISYKITVCIFFWNSLSFYITVWFPLACHCEITCVKYNYPIQVFKEVGAFVCLRVYLSVSPIIIISPASILPRMGGRWWHVTKKEDASRFFQRRALTD